MFLNKKPLMPCLCCLLLLGASSTLSWELPVSENECKATVINEKDNALAGETIPAPAFIEEYTDNIYTRCDVEGAGLKADVFREAYIGFLNLKERGKVPRHAKVLSIVDFDLSST